MEPPPEFKKAIKDLPTIRGRVCTATWKMPVIQIRGRRGCAKKKETGVNLTYQDGSWQ